MIAGNMIDSNRAVRAELDLLVSQGLIDEGQRKAIASLYPAGAWNILVIIRCFTVIGAIAAAAGLFLLIKDFFSTYLILEVVLTGAVAGLFAVGRWLMVKKKMVRAGAAVHLLMAFALSGLTFTLGLHHSTGSGNWPALVGIDAALFIALAYLLDNRLILAYACVNLFVWFGGQTGYVSGWGMYWLGMNYPLRFLIAGAVCVGIGAAHTMSPTPLLKRFAHFNRVYFHFGLLIMNLSLWFFSLFGYYEGRITWENNDAQRLLFTALWFACSGGATWYGLRRDNGIFRSHGLVFLIINCYTVYFQFIAAKSAELWFLHTLFMGGSMLALGIYLERKRRGSENDEGAPGD